MKPAYRITMASWDIFVLFSSLLPLLTRQLVLPAISTSPMLFVAARWRGRGGETSVSCARFWDHPLSELFIVSDAEINT